MFNKKLLIACTCITAYVPLCLANDANMCVDIKGKKCKTFNSVNICNYLNVGGNLTVGGTGTFGGAVTASSFSTPTMGLLFNGLRNWAVFSNQEAVGNGGTVLFADASSANTAGITNTAGSITLPVGGIFLVMYTVRFSIAAATASGLALAQLQQTVGGTPTDISFAVINTFDETAAGTAISSQVSGYALITTTSTSNNVINLIIGLDTGFTLPLATGTDANAQITILQMN